MTSCCQPHPMPWNGATDAIARCKRVSTACGVVYLYRAGNSVACKTGIMPPFHHHIRGQRDGITPLFLPAGAVGPALALLHVALCVAQRSRRRPPEALPASLTTPQ